MKKLFYLLYLLPVAFFASCNDKDDLANVDLTLTLGGVTQTEENGVFYTVAGEEITIEKVGVKSLTSKDAALANVMYYFEGFPVMFDPETSVLGIDTEDFEAGTYTLSLTGQILQVDKTLTNFASSYSIVVVESSEDLPEGAPEIGSYSITRTLSPK